jgi:hypothetical protein
MMPEMWPKSVEESETYGRGDEPVRFLGRISGKHDEFISPGFSITLPFSFGMITQPAGTMLETVTKLQCCIPASLSANSKD